MRSCVLEMPEAPWLQVPVVEDPDGWGIELARQLCEGEDVATDDLAGLAAELSVLARDAAEREAVLAAGLLELPDAEGARPFVVASLVVLEVACGATVDDVVAELDVTRPEDLEVPEVRVVDLPAGQAVRLRTLTATPPDGTVVEAVNVVLPLGDGTGVSLQLSWMALAAGDVLGDLADQCAAGIRVIET